jgi:hypothetical protein
MALDLNPYLGLGLKHSHRLVEDRVVAELKLSFLGIE